jgi:predicted transcriptional regulator
MTKKDKTLQIIIGGDYDKDFENLLNGEVNIKEHPKNVIYLDSFAQLNKLLSPAKLDLFNYLVEFQDEKNPESLSKIAKDLKRKQEAISRDMKQLNNLGLVMLKKVKQTIYAMPNYNSIEITTAI